jgi:uncharacterized protein
MACGYCFYADEGKRRNVANYGIMTQETAAAVISSVFCDLSDGDKIVFAFQGGEPTIAGLSFYEYFISEVEKQTVKAAVSYALQTNGILADETWCEFFKRHNFLVGLSLDGYMELHNSNRTTIGGVGTFSRVMKAKKLLDKYAVDYNILAVLTNAMARHPQKVWNFIANVGVRYIQFIPCLDELGPRNFYNFYSAIFPLWKRHKSYVSVKLFEDIIDMFIYGRATACGLNGQCQPQFVVEADGGVYPCDFYALDEFKLGNLTKDSLRQTFESQVSKEFRAKRAVARICEKCRYRPSCNGGCKRQFFAICGHDKDFCGYSMLLDEILPQL